MKPSKSNQKPKGKERTFETQTTTKITVITGRLKKNPRTRTPISYLSFIPSTRIRNHPKIVMHIPCQLLPIISSIS
jgi:hypothetical protein